MNFLDLLINAKEIHFLHRFLLSFIFSLYLCTRKIGLKIRVSPVRFLEVPLLLSLARFSLVEPGFLFLVFFLHISGKCLTFAPYYI